MAACYASYLGAWLRWRNRARCAHAILIAVVTVSLVQLNPSVRAARTFSLSASSNCGGCLGVSSSSVCANFTNTREDGVRLNQPV